MIADFFHPYVGGVEQHVRNLSQALARRGHNVLVATLTHPDRPGWEIDNSVRVVRIQGLAQRGRFLHQHAHRPWAPPVPDPLVSRALDRIVRRFRPDIVHGHDWLARSYLPVRPFHPARFILTLHYYTTSCAKKTLMRNEMPCDGPEPGKCFSCVTDHYGAVKGPALLGLHRGTTILERGLVDHLIAVSQATARGNRISDGPDLSIIPNMLSGSQEECLEIKSYAERLPNEPFLLYVGDFRRDKGLDVLLSAYTRLHDAPPLVLIGKTWNASPSSLPPGVVELGEWPHAAVQAAWRACGIAIVPSVWAEPFGLVVIEAMRAGKPVVASRVGGIPEIIDHGETGWLVEPDDPEELASAISHLLLDDHLASRLGTNAREASYAYDESCVVGRIEDLYQSLITRSAA